MSRSKPKNTLLLYVEGYSEKIFLEHIRGIYARGNDVKVTIKSGSGGSPEAIVSEALREIGSFDRRAIVMDNDGKIKEMEKAREKAKKGNVKIIENTPCLEGVLLSILETEKSYPNKSSSKCKKEFESRYISKQRRKDKEEYKKHFPKEILDERRKHVKELDILISLFETSK